MRLGINITGLYPGKIGGAEQYIRNIVAKLEEHEDITTYLFLNESALSTFKESDRLKLIKIDLNYDHNLQLNAYIDLYNIDVWFCPLFYLVPDNCPVPNVTAIFDIQQDYFPENFDPTVLRQRKQLTSQTVHATDMILTISDFSKKTLLEKYQLSPDNIKVTYLDADASFSLPVDPKKLAAIRKKLPKDFILFPANMWPHKNHAALIKGFALAREKYHLPLQLVFTGAKERETAQIEELIRQTKLRDHITYLGYIPQDDMRYVFRCAKMLAFPSFFEGFGIPLVEAMASDLPILCSTASCVPEIAGDAALLFDPNSPEEICEAIYRIYSDPALRSDLIARGQKRRQDFSWDKCAMETVQYLRSMYKPRKLPAPRLSKHPKVTIVTPSYNQGEYIRDTIESVLNQTYDNIEYIVMDGGSTDDTVEILKSYGDRIKWVSEKDGGQADAVNKGIRIAQGEIIGWLNSDDTYYPNAVEIAVSTLLEHPDTDMVYGEGDYIDREGNVTSRYATKMFDYGLLASECFICQPTAFFTKEIVTKVGLLNASLQLCMDYELWMRIGKAGKVLYVPDHLATSRMYEENKTMSRRSEVYSECCREVKRHFGFVPHDWIMGYAYYTFSMRPKIDGRLHYLWHFFHYNYNAPAYIKQRALEVIANRKLRRAARNTPPPIPANGWYGDGWMVKEYSKELQCSGKENLLIVEGTHHLPFSNPLVLTLTVNGKSMSFSLKKTGNFTLRMPIKPLSAGHCTVTISANQQERPSAMIKSKDHRLLSVFLSKVDVVKK